MLWTITIILVVLWLLGFVGFHVLGSWIHLLLILAIIVLIFNLLSGRRGI
ncbi:lmo0937 family membrane protein [Granulicella cerasi]|uniref:Lmo0937 family membrane protein n=1 Tax=Granulicella cerasi TaxID=741063 RepID=A0ABW1ZF89_9BACT|nr:lmo0937 family membrane protein [Granulicella cerasi]